jgi:hypothetical protein
METLVRVPPKVAAASALISAATCCGVGMAAPCAMVVVSFCGAPSKRTSSWYTTLMDPTKTCCHCRRTLPLDQFYRNRATPDGYTRECRTCAKERASAHYRENRERILSEQRGHYLAHSTEVQARNRAWLEANRERHRPYLRAYNREYRRKYPERHRAGSAVADALKSGKIQRQETCAMCGAAPTEAHHHRGYEKEHYLDVIWLCRRCHRAQARR